MMNLRSGKQLRFRLQSMLVVFTALCLLMGLVARELNREFRKGRLSSQIADGGGRVHLVDPAHMNPELLSYRSTGVVNGWLRLVLGNEYFKSARAIELTPSSGLALEVVRYFPELDHLSIGGSDVNVETSKAMEGLVVLTGLNISDAVVSESCLRSLTRIPELRLLHLRNCTISKNAAECLAQFSSLLDVKFEGCDPPPEFIQEIKEIPNLRIVKFDRCPIDNNKLQCMHHSPFPVTIQFDGCPITEVGMLELREANPAWEIIYQDQSASNTSALNVAQPNRIPSKVEIGSVELLSFQGELVSNATLQALKNAKGLRHLSLKNMNAEKVTSEGLKVLEQLPNLTEFHYTDSIISSEDINVIARLKSLRHLHLNNSKLSDVNVEAISHDTSLELLSLWGCPVTDESVDSLSKMNSLKSLWIGSTRISANGLLKLKDALPNCEILSR
jgi:Leucine-rich repeat (LRR) protein